MADGAFETLAVVGAGNMGSGIAQKMASEGFTVILVDLDEEKVQRGLRGIEQTLTDGIERKLFTPERVKDILSRIRGTTRFADLANVDLVVEAVAVHVCECDILGTRLRTDRERHEEDEVIRIAPPDVDGSLVVVGNGEIEIAVSIDVAERGSARLASGVEVRRREDSDRAVVEDCGGVRVTVRDGEVEIAVTTDVTHGETSRALADRRAGEGCPAAHQTKTRRAMTSATVRQRRRRERLANGRIQLTIEADEVALLEALHEARLLDPLVDHDRCEIERAVERLIEMIAERE